jgi:hypothetical protein
MSNETVRVHGDAGPQPEGIDASQVLKSVRAAVARLRGQAARMHVVLQRVARLPAISPESSPG